MIGDRQPFPVRHKRVFHAAQHRAEVMCVMKRRIKIRVVADPRRQLHGDISLAMKCAGAQLHIITQCWGTLGEKVPNCIARLFPRAAAERHKRIE